MPLASVRRAALLRCTAPIVIPSAPTAVIPARNLHGIGAASHRVGLLRFAEQTLSPALGVLSLWLLAWAIEGGIRGEHLLLAVIVFALTFPGRSRLELTPRRIAVDVLIGWAGVFGLLWAACLLLGYDGVFAPTLLIAWAVAVPLLDTAGWLALRQAAPALARLQGPPERAVLVGMNAHGLALATRLRGSVLGQVEVLGFVDDRDAQRLAAEGSGFAHLGDTTGLAELVQRQRVERIYVTLPMTSQPRILRMLEDLKDTTASVCFVPDMFVTDLIQGRSKVLCGMPVIAVCHSPFNGTAGLTKRASDVVLATLILLLAPALLAIALAVKLSSPGPLIFKQRRYGQDGEEIVVQKFRSMTCAEDGAVVTQARAGDQRVTRIGVVLRCTSLDELPQFELTEQRDLVFDLRWPLTGKTLLDLTFTHLARSHPRLAFRDYAGFTARAALHWDAIAKARASLRWSSDLNSFQTDHASQLRTERGAVVPQTGTAACTSGRQPAAAASLTLPAA